MEVCTPIKHNQGFKSSPSYFHNVEKVRSFTPRRVRSPCSRNITPRKTTPIRLSGAHISKPTTSPLKFDVVGFDWNSNSENSNSKGPIKKQLIRVNSQADRFIPNRNSSNTNISKVESNINNKNSDSTENTVISAEEYEARSSALAYQSSVAEACGIAINQRILAFKPAAPQSSKAIDLRSEYNRPLKPVSAQLRRRIPTVPERVLDAPGLIDDYYLNLLDWSCTNQLAIGLERNVYVWNAETGSVSSLMESSLDTYISSVKWSAEGAYLSIGLADGDVQIWDVAEGVKLRSMNGHSARVGVLSWDKHILSSGCRDGSIWNHDVRIAEHKVSEFLNHSSEVCGLEWRSDGGVLASGGNDNLVNIWDARCTTPKFTKTNHKAAVKALAWCPWQTNLLATGGGSYDKHIHFWSASTGARVNSIDTGSQVTAIKWSTVYKELASCHGYPDNHIAVWSYPSLVKNAEIAAHDSRVLHACLSPDGSTLATAASDENLKFWKIFENASKKSSSTVRGRIGTTKELGKVAMIR